ncbi:bifunctional diaminohydroxyphosphoribosylaminopyrimidine deaminase/5-amino-6-(5-phosphoribosylamino)uracil reductase RibD [Helicobacter aurati]|nr:bifunctional diaminohydroxyphosphoribosylaminopyrimidine deaminase/5-amino-6-(5-phosphoribosylamino)uracil reductase RibD [Helicobacter aurati]
MDSHFMRLAIDYAWQFQTLTLPNPAVGALIVANNEIIALQAHYKVGMPHAEVLACQEALLYFFASDIRKREILSQAFVAQKEYFTCSIPQNVPADSFVQSVIESFQTETCSEKIYDFLMRFHCGIFYECDLFITLEPCNHHGKTPPCAKLIAAIQPNRIFVGCSEPTSKASGGFQTLRNIPITQNVLFSEASKLLYPFLVWQEKSHFTLFKIAQRLDGTYHNGVISNMDSRIFTHNMRCVADYIVISGETLRHDNPLLDNRFSIAPYTDSKLPTIFVLSKTLDSKDLQKFRIGNRNVHIARNVQELPTSGFIVIEGGFAFLISLLEECGVQEQRTPFIVDSILGYIAPTLSTFSNALCNEEIPIDVLQRHGFSLSHTYSLLDFWQKKAGRKIEDLQRNIVYWLIRDRDC